MKTLKSRFTSLWLCLACQHQISCCFVKYNSSVISSLWLALPTRSAREVSPGNRSNYKSTRERVDSKGLYGPWRELLECLLGSLVPRRFRLGHSWTLPWVVTSPRDTHRERVLSPALSQTSSGERIKREGLGTRLPPRNFAFWAKSLRGQQLTLTWSPFPPQIAGASRGGRM